MVKCIEDEIPFDVPEGWAWCRVESFCEMINGTSKRSGTSGIATIVLRLADLLEHDITLSDCRRVALSPSDVEKYALRTDDVLFIRVNGSRQNVGKSYSFQEYVVPVAFCDHIIRGRLDGRILSKLFCSFMQSGYIRSIVESRIVSAAGQNTISQPSIGSILIPIPPASEQNEVMRRIYLLTEHVNHIEDGTNDLHDMISRIKSKILDLAIRGKLVPQDPNDEPASVLLERIRAERESLVRAGKIKRNKRESIIFRGDDNSYYQATDGVVECIDPDLPFDIPDSWSWSRVGDVFVVNPRNHIDGNTVVSFVSMPFIEEGFQNSFRFEERLWADVKTGFTHFQEGDLGLAKITPCFENRKSVVFLGLKNGYGAGTTELHILRPIDHTIDVEYALWFLKTSSFINEGIQTFSGAVGQQRIGRDYLESTYFPIPPLEEQHRIVVGVKSLFAQLDMISTLLI